LRRNGFDVVIAVVIDVLIAVLVDVLTDVLNDVPIDLLIDVLIDPLIYDSLSTEEIFTSASDMGQQQQDRRLPARLRAGCGNLSRVGWFRRAPNCCVI
jgi:hypothetical protein